MSQDVNQDWTNRNFVESIEMALRKCVDFLGDFHEQAKYRLSEVDQRLTSLERKADFIEAQLLNADPSERNAKPKSFKGSTFDPTVRREQVKKFRERLLKTEKVFSDKIIAPKKEDGARGKLIVGGPSAKKSQPKEILGAPKSQGKGNIPIAQMQKQMSQKQSSNDNNNANPPAPTIPSKVNAAPPAVPPVASVPKQDNRPPPPSAAEAQAAMVKKEPKPPVPNIANIPPAIPNNVGKPPSVPKPPGPPSPVNDNGPGANIGGPPPPKPPGPPANIGGPPPPQPPGPPSGENEPGAEGTSNTGEGGTPGDGGPGNDGFPHGDPNAIDMQIIRPGSGNVPGGKSKVEVEYTGYLADGSKFIEHKETLSLGLKQNIKGLEVGLQRMQEGTFAKLWIPFKLAYGPRGAPPLIPQNADLTFEITLIKILD